MRGQLKVKPQTSKCSKTLTSLKMPSDPHIRRIRFPPVLIFCFFSISIIYRVSPLARYGLALGYGTVYGLTAKLAYGILRAGGGKTRNNRALDSRVLVRDSTFRRFSERLVHVQLSTRASQTGYPRKDTVSRVPVMIRAPSPSLAQSQNRSPCRQCSR